MTVSGVQVAGVAWAVFAGGVPGCHSKPSVFDIWAMPEDGPPNGLQRFAVIVEVAGQCLSQLRRPCSPLSCGSTLRSTWEGSSSSHDPFFSRVAA
jgi:hypothetical protein